MKRTLALALLAGCATAAADGPDPADVKRQMHAIYEELVEIDTTQSNGDTAKAARAMAARLKAAGFAAADVQVFETAPKRGNLVARLRGTGKKRPLLLLAHIDVVEAKREDWSTDPFTLVEQDGYFYGRGTGDDKYMAAAFVANLIRYKAEGYKPDRDLILVLETDEEISDKHGYGIKWLLANKRELIDAELALNEGAGVALKDGKPVIVGLQTAEKLFQTFWIEARNPGGHSAQPRKDNAIYQLARGLGRLEKHEFPIELNETTRAFFARMATMETGQVAKDMKAMAGAKPNPAAAKRLAAQPPYNAQMRTTCVATRLEAGHADNALPQLARAIVNCRILPGHTVEEVQATLVKVLADPGLVVSAPERDTGSPPTALDPAVTGAIEQLIPEFWPGTPLLPSMSAGATSGRYLRNAGIPTFGHGGLAGDMFDNRAHGKDERVLVESVDRGQEYLYRLVKLLAGGQ